MKTVYQVSQKFSTETETEELLTKDFENYQDAKDYFEEINNNAMKIILRQFLVVNPDNNEEQRTKLTFAQLHKKFKRGIVYLEQ